jgi:isopenicillin-N epimerase
MERRAFLRTVGVGLAGSLGAKSYAAENAPRPIAAPHTGPWTWHAVRGEFALDPNLVHMTGFFLASHPRVVREALEEHRRAFDDNPVHYLEENVARYETALRRAAADYFAAEPDDFAVTDSTTMGLGIVYGGLKLTEGQEILTTTHDHIVTTHALQHRAERTGSPLRQVALYDDPAIATADAIVARFEQSIRPETRAVAVTWVHSGTGVKLPIRRMADVLVRVNAGRDEKDRVLLFVDGVHGFGVEDETGASLGCDFLIAGTHKWLFGPRGTGLVWARKGAWSATMPTIPTMDPFWRPGGRESMPPAAWMTPGGFQPFEHRWAVEQAFRFHLEIGKARVADRIHELNRVCKQELSKMPRVRVATPMAEEVSAGIICFDVEGMDPYAVVERLKQQRIVASVVPGFYVPLHVRLAPGLLTLEPDVERALAAVRALS